MKGDVKISGLTPFLKEDGSLKYKVNYAMSCNDKIADVENLLETLKDPKTILIRTCEEFSLFELNDKYYKIFWQLEEIKAEKFTDYRRVPN